MMFVVVLEVIPPMPYNYYFTILLYKLKVVSMVEGDIVMQWFLDWC